MIAEDIRVADSHARDLFTYKSDGKIDTWRSHVADVIAHRHWEGDCDDLTSTALDLLGHAGTRLEDRYFLIVHAESDGSGHAVGCVVDTENRFWIVGDTFYPHPYLAEQIKHKPNMYHRQNEISDGQLQWRGGFPWEIVD